MVRLVMLAAARMEARVMLRRWRRDAKNDLPAHHFETHQFEDRLRVRWAGGLDGLDLLWLRAHTLGSEFNERKRPDAAQESDFEFEALVRLHARACRVASEALALLRTGHADGAHARWRTLHETAVTMFFIHKHGRQVAERYLLHDLAQEHKRAEQYERYRDRLGYKPFSQSQLDEMRRRRDTLVARFGPEYGRDYGWAAEVLGIRRPTFIDIELAMGMDHWRPWYRMASEAQHAGGRAIRFTLGLRSGEDLLLAGPSNAGLADPGISVALSLSQATTALLTHRADLRSLRAANALQRLARHVEASFNRERLRAE